MSTRTERFTVARDPHLEVRLSRADVRVVGSGTDEVVVELSGRDPDQVRVELVGATVRVHEEGARFRSVVGSATLHVPEGTRLEIDLASGDTTVDVPVRDARLRTASGDVSARELTGRAEIRSASGDVRLQTTDELSVTTASGEIAIDHVRGSTSLNSASGDVRLGRVEGDTSIKTASGDVHVLRLAARRLDVKTASGDTAIGIGPGRHVSYDLHSLSGSAHAQPPSEVSDPHAPREPTRIAVRSLSGDLELRPSR